MLANNGISENINTFYTHYVAHGIVQTYVSGVLLSTVNLVRIVQAYGLDVMKRCRACEYSCERYIILYCTMFYFGRIQTRANSSSSKCLQKSDGTDTVKSAAKHADKVLEARDCWCPLL